MNIERTEIGMGVFCASVLMYEYISMRTIACLVQPNLNIRYLPEEKLTFGFVCTCGYFSKKHERKANSQRANAP